MRRRDALAALVFSAWCTVEVLGGPGDQDAVRLACALAVTLPMALREVSPWIPLAGAVLGFTPFGALSQQPLQGMVPPMLLALFTIADRRPLRPALAGLAAVLGGTVVQNVVSGDPDALFIAVVLVLPAWGAGRAMRSRRAREAELERLRGELEAERERVARLAAEAERSRVAREMHDALSHGLSLMVLQAGAGPRLLERDPEEAARAMAAIRAAGERALAELDQLFDATAAPPAPLAELAAGVRARLVREGADEPLPPAIEVTARRIVQEALTNAVKHAPGAEVTVRVRQEPGRLLVTVTDEGGSAGAPLLRGSGRGLAGMRERAHLYGGDLEAGPRPEGGFAVRARLPLP